MNLAPADLKKEGPAYDLPLALVVVMASDQVPHLTARERRRARFKGKRMRSNAEMGPAEVREFCRLEAAAHVAEAAQYRPKERV